MYCMSTNMAPYIVGMSLAHHNQYNGQKVFYTHNVSITIYARIRMHDLSPVLENVNKTVNTYIHIVCYGRNDNMIYRNYNDS